MPCDERMRRQNMKNLDGKIGRRKCKVRKRGCSSSSSSSNCRLKRSGLVATKSSTTLPMWKLLSSKSPSMENSNAFSFTRSGERGKESSVSARKLAATLWEMNGFLSPNVKRETSEEGSDFQILRKQGHLGSSKLGEIVPSSQEKITMRRRRAAAAPGSLKLLHPDHDHEGIRSVNSALLEVDRSSSRGRSSYRHGSNNRLKDVYNGLKTSKELIAATNRACRFDRQNSAASSLFSVLRLELNRICIDVTDLLNEQKAKDSEVEILLGQFEEERAMWRLKEQDRICSAVASIVGELETEKKRRRQMERLNAQLGHELAETKKSLSKATKQVGNQERALKLLGQDRTKMEVLRLRSENAAVTDKLRNKLKVDDHSPRCRKIMELEKYLRETLPGACRYEEDEDEDDSDLHSIELNIQDPTKGLRLIQAAEEAEERCVEWDFRQENFEHGRNKDTSSEMERYRMIKDLRDRIVSGARVDPALDHSTSTEINK